MSQHNILKNTRKKLTYLAVALSLASAQVAAYGAASALDATPTSAGMTGQSAAAMPNDGRADGQNSPDRAASNKPVSDTSSTGQNWQGSMGSAHGEVHADGAPKEVRSDGGPAPTPTPIPTPKEEQRPQPINNENQNKNENENENKNQVIVKPNIRNEVNNEVNLKQETNVTVQQQQRQQQAAAAATPVVVRKQVVAAAATTPTTTRVQAQAQAQTPVVSGGKGALEETGFSAKPATLAGLGILGALGALSVVTRRNKDFARG